jgi:hypothetical protein
VSLPPSGGAASGILPGVIRALFDNITLNGPIGKRVNFNVFRMRARKGDHAGFVKLVSRALWRNLVVLRGVLYGDAASACRVEAYYNGYALVARLLTVIDIGFTCSDNIFLDFDHAEAR